MVSFRYVEFYDVPRAIVLRHKGKLLLLQSAFDDQVDEYPDTYTVYALPESVEASLAKGSWRFLEELPLISLGQISVQDVHFDPTKRKSLDPSVLDTLTMPESN